MADPKEAVVEVEDEGVVQVDVSDNPELATVTGVDGGEPVVEATEAEPKEAKKPVPRVKIVEPADQQTSEVLKKSLEASENARKAAEATAATERAQREAAERRAADATQQAESAQEEIANRELSIITTGIEGAQREIASYQEDMTRLYEAGEFGKVAAVQVKMSKASAVLDRLEAAKITFESKPKQPVTEGRVEAPVTATPFEQYVTRGGFSPQAQTWLRSHPECVPPQFGGRADMNAKMMKGHYDALEKNIEPNSPEYFRVIEEHTGFRQPMSAASDTTEAGEEPAPKPKPAAKKLLPSAPPSREPPSATTGIPKTTRQVSLNKEQQEAARMSFPHLKPNEAYANYARNLLELEAEGKLGRLTH